MNSVRSRPAFSVIRFSRFHWRCRLNTIHGTTPKSDLGAERDMSGGNSAISPSECPAVSLLGGDCLYRHFAVPCDLDDRRSASRVVPDGRFHEAVFGDARRRPDASFAHRFAGCFGGCSAAPGTGSFAVRIPRPHRDSTRWFYGIFPWPCSSALGLFVIVSQYPTLKFPEKRLGRD